MNRFQRLNPSVQLVFYLLSIVVVLVCNSVAISLVSLVCALFNSVYIYHKKTLKMALYSVLMIAVATVFNMIFVHSGENVLFEIGQIKFTLEALNYGINQGLIISGVFIWFAVMSKSIDSEGVAYLLRYTPKFALMFSMILGFIPRFSRKLNDIKDSRIGINGGKSPATKKEQLRDSIEVLSALVTYSLESSIITANSMEGRGYNPRAIRRGRYKFKSLDFVLMIIMIVLFCASFLLLQRSKVMLYSYGVNEFLILSIVALAIVELIPCIINLKEEILWKLSQRRD